MPAHPNEREEDPRSRSTTTSDFSVENFGNLSILGKVFGPTLGEGVITCIFSMFWFRFNELGLFNVSRVPKYRLSHYSVI